MIRKGGEWLLEAAAADAVFTPEQLTDEHRLIAQTVERLRRQRSAAGARSARAEGLGAGARAGASACGELGLLGVDVPETYGGVQLDKVTSMVVSERMSRSASFGATFGAQANLMVLPLSLFGTEAQKRKYLPRLLTGEIDRRVLR